MAYKPSIKFTHVKSVATIKMTVRDAIRSAIDEEMVRDPEVFLMGEEVA